MINFWIIEDDKYDFNRIETHLHACKTKLKKEYYIDINIENVPCWDIDPDFPVFWERFLSKPIDIIVLDYDLNWKNKIAFNGIKVLEKIAQVSKKELPYIIFTSSKFKQYDNIYDDFGDDLTSVFVDHSIHVKDKFLKNEDKFINNTVKIILSAIKNLPPRIELDLYTYPFEIDRYDNHNDFRWSILRNKKGIDKSLKIINESNFICILTGFRDKYCVLYVEESEILIKLINYPKHFNMSNIRAEFMKGNFKIQDASKIIYNPNNIYISKEGTVFSRNKETMINLNPNNILSYDMISFFLILMKKEINDIENHIKVLTKEYEKDDNNKKKFNLDEENINPFVKVFKRIK